ncbi:MAG: serine/threonine-protein kinase [Terracidiphilus sp.]|nr:serine/threonine-protein kinase [Terracidiphilus sp.]MDR3799483.1 serine/threonine-protein kinase [Terracidiphilus sp.]
MALEIGNLVGDYEILSLLGAGGMGRVFKVRNVISNREDAIKILLPDLASEPELAARFMAEIRTLAALDHPNIAQLRTAFQFQNQFVMVMEFVEGTGLDKLAAQSRLPLDQVIDYSMQVLSALSYAHSRGVTHRDIKPANLMITTHGLVKLMDFGIAKSTNEMQLTRPGSTMGSVYYMSPEQVRGGAIDARSDIYSFGVTLYEMLTGRKPFLADTSYSVLNAHLNQNPTPPMELDPSLPAELNNIVLRAMAKPPEARFQTAAEFRDALKAVREPQIAQAVAAPQAAPVPGFQAFPGFQPVPGQSPAMVQGRPLAQPIRPAKSHRSLWIATGALAVVLAVVGAFALLPRFFPTRASQSNQPNAPLSTTVQPANSPASSAEQPAASVPSQPAAPTPAPQATGEKRPPYSSAPSARTTAPPGNRTAMPGAAQQAPSSPNVETHTPPPPQPAGPSAAEIRKVRDELMNLQSRADTASASVEQLRRQEQASGMDLRGDILTAMSQMKSNIREAQNALDQKDLTTAEEYLGRADQYLNTLETFLGR